MHVVWSFVEGCLVGFEWLVYQVLPRGPSNVPGRNKWWFTSNIIKLQIYFLLHKDYCTRFVSLTQTSVCVVLCEWGTVKAEGPGGLQTPDCHVAHQPCGQRAKSPWPSGVIRSGGGHPIDWLWWWASIWPINPWWFHKGHDSFHGSTVGDNMSSCTSEASSPTIPFWNLPLQSNVLFPWCLLMESPLVSLTPWHWFNQTGRLKSPTQCGRCFNMIQIAQRLSPMFT